MCMPAMRARTGKRLHSFDLARDAPNPSRHRTLPDVSHTWITPSGSCSPQIPMKNLQAKHV